MSGDLSSTPDSSTPPYSISGAPSESPITPFDLEEILSFPPQLVTPAEIVDHLTAHPPDEAVSARALKDLSPEYRPTGLLVLHPNQHIEIEAQGVIFDVDETILQGTGEHVHDGPHARFAQALGRLLAAQGIDFDLSRWDSNYRMHTGISETDVCNKLAVQAFDDYGVILSPRTIQDESHRVLEEGFLAFMEKVRLVENVHSLVDRVTKASLKLAVCTASSGRFIQRALEHFGLFSKFQAHVFEATKKVGDGVFSEVSIQEACQRIKLAPQTCVMIGDSIADFGAAASGERPLDLVVLRLPSGERDQALRKFQEQREHALAKNGDALSRTVVVVVSDYDQVKIRYSPQARVSFKVPPVE